MGNNLPVLEPANGREFTAVRTLRSIVYCGFGDGASAFLASHPRAGVRLPCNWGGREDGARNISDTKRLKLL
jgi:hypothetical protein